MSVAQAASIRPATGPHEIEVVRALFAEYAAELPVDLAFQGFAEELATLPGAYAGPRGVLLLAWADDLVAGCVGVRPLAPGACELKRLYVRPAFRGRGLARRLMAAAVAEARSRRYARILLDTLPGMIEAQRLYRRSASGRYGPTGRTRCRERCTWSWPL
ncbi:MAG TPA: GNAT family N-acetyltransferase [Gemmatimonadales bacterium]